jgi:uncharacterized protein YjbJ (UPF0337 family)
LKKEERMNADILKGKWKEIKGAIRERWGDLTDDEIDQVAGRQERLLGLLQTKYGYAREDAEREYAEFMELFEETSWRDTGTSGRGQQ